MLRGEAAAPLAEVRVLFIATSILRCARNLRSGVFIGKINRTNRPILWTNRPEPIPATIAAQDFDEMPGAVRCRGVIHTHTPCRMSRAHPGQAIQLRGPCSRCGERRCRSHCRCARNGNLIGQSAGRPAATAPRPEFNVTSISKKTKALNILEKGMYINKESIGRLLRGACLGPVSFSLSIAGLVATLNRLHDSDLYLCSRAHRRFSAGSYERLIVGFFSMNGNERNHNERRGWVQLRATNEHDNFVR